MFEAEDEEVEEGSSHGTQPLRHLAETVTDLRHLGTLLQSLPKITRELTAYSPENPELMHLVDHGFPNWPLIETADRYRRLSDETILCRVVESFHLYLYDVLRLCIHRDHGRFPEYDSLEAEALDRAVSRKISDLSYDGLPAITAYVGEKVGSFLIEGSSFIDFTEAIALRNLIVDNHAMIDSRFLAVAGRTDLTAGSLYVVETPQVLAWLIDLEVVTLAIDRILVDRFQLPVEEIYPSQNESVQ